MNLCFQWDFLSFRLSSLYFDWHQMKLKLKAKVKISLIYEQYFDDKPILIHFRSI